MVEVVFAWPGVGRLIFDGIRDFDYPVIEAGVVVIASSIVIANLLVDLILPLHRSANQSGGDLTVGSGFRTLVTRHRQLGEVLK